MNAMIFNMMNWERKFAEMDEPEVPAVAAFYAEREEQYSNQPGWLLKAEKRRGQPLLAAECRPMKQKKALL